MKSLFVSLLFTLVTTTTMAQTIRPSYDWNQFNEQSYQTHKKELIEYYDFKKEEVIKDYSSGWRANYPQSKQIDLEEVERNRKSDLDDLEFNYKIQTRSQLEKTISSIKVFLNSNKIKYGVAPICVGIIIGYLLVFYRKRLTKP